MTAGNAFPLGDRHHRPDPLGKLRDRSLHGGARIRLRISPALAMTRVGQLGAWLCINLLARLEGLIDQIELDCPCVATHPDMKVLALRSPVAPELPRTWRKSAPEPPVLGWPSFKVRAGGAP